MIKMLLPIVLVVFSNVFYNLSTKLTPSDANSFLSLTVTYVTAAILSFIVFCTTGHLQNLTTEFSKLNWTSVLLGVSIVGLELGYIYIYRVGWKIGVGSLVANISLACILVLVGVLFFKEALSYRQCIGLAVCLLGLILITR